MTDRAAMDACYADFKLVKTRSVCQLVLEIPIERAEEAIRKFGIPQPGKEIPVALALLVKVPEVEAPAAPNVAKIEAARAKYRALPEWGKAVTRSALLCKDPKFWKYINFTSPDDWCDSEEKAASALKTSLNIKSRSDIGTDERAFREFIALETEFQLWSGALPEVRG